MLDTHRPILRATLGAIVLAAALACYQDPKGAARKSAASAERARAQAGSDTSAAAAAGLTPVPPAEANDSTLRALQHYRLTTAALTKWAAAQRNLNAATSRDPSIVRDMANETRPSSMDEVVARIDAKPALHAAIHDAGLSAREYLLFAAAFQQALQGYALQRGGKLPDNVPPTVMANIDFVGQNMVTIRQLVGPALSSQPDSPP